MSDRSRFDVVVPTVGRPSLERLLEALARADGPLPGRVLLVDDRRRPDRPLLPGGVPGRLARQTVVIGGRAAGPAAARNDGWRRATATWVALPAARPPTDWERNVAALEGARWATADLAYRRAVLAEVGGFDERFRRAYREDADLALRVVRAGYRIEQGG